MSQSLPLSSQSLTRGAPMRASNATYLMCRLLREGGMRTKRLEAMTIRQLVAEYNSHGPVRPLKTWKGKKYDLFLKVRAAEKQKWIAETPESVDTSES